jgi:hypothetical protein
VTYTRPFLRGSAEEACSRGQSTQGWVLAAQELDMPMGAPVPLTFAWAAVPSCWTPGRGNEFVFVTQEEVRARVSCAPVVQYLIESG